jgi:hypothetical protein
MQLSGSNNTNQDAKIILNQIENLYLADYSFKNIIQIIKRVI